jgi:hypothetical protein
MPRPNGDHTISILVGVVVLAFLAYTVLLGLSLLYLRRAFLEDLCGVICIAEIGVEEPLSKLLRPVP